MGFVSQELKNTHRLQSAPYPPAEEMLSPLPLFHMVLPRFSHPSSIQHTNLAYPLIGDLQEAAYTPCTSWAPQAKRDLQRHSAHMQPGQVPGHRAHGSNSDHPSSSQLFASPAIRTWPVRDLPWTPCHLTTFCFTSLWLHGPFGFLLYTEHTSQVRAVHPPANEVQDGFLVPFCNSPVLIPVLRQICFS